MITGKSPPCRSKEAINGTHAQDQALTTCQLSQRLAINSTHAEDLALTTSPRRQRYVTMALSEQYGHKDGQAETRDADTVKKQDVIMQRRNKASTCSEEARHGHAAKKQDIDM